MALAILFLHPFEAFNTWRGVMTPDSMGVMTPEGLIAEALGRHYAVAMGECLCGWKAKRVKIGESWRPEFDEHQASVIAAITGIEITRPGTSDAMLAFAHGSISKQRVLEDIAYVLTGWRYEEPEDTWEAVAAIAKGMGNGALVAEVEKSYTEAARAAGGHA